MEAVNMNMQATWTHNNHEKLQRIPPQIAKKLVQVVQSSSGIAVNAENQAFLELRISRRARELGFSLEDYLDYFMGYGQSVEKQTLVEMLATHTTDFFREIAHYEFLKSISLPDLHAKGAGREWPLTIWSAACSIGSELWSAGIVADQFARAVLGGLRIRLHGTDISNRVLERAKSAAYTQDEIRGLPEDLRKIYLLRAKPHTARAVGQSPYRICRELRNIATFQAYNLVRPTQDIGFTADVAFLRNVLIYFSAEDQIAALNSVKRSLRMGGYLFLGHSESLSSKVTGLTQIAPATYQRTSDVQ